MIAVTPIIITIGFFNRPRNWKPCLSFGFDEGKEEEERKKVEDTIHDNNKQTSEYVCSY